MGKKGGSRGVLASWEVQRGVAALIRELGEGEAARVLGVGRNALIRIVGRFTVRAGTLALVGDRLARRGHGTGGDHAAE